MSQPNDYAYPTGQTYNYQGNLGLTKREYFAGLAMQGVVTNNEYLSAEVIARLSIELADELLKQLDE